MSKKEESGHPVEYPMLGFQIRRANIARAILTTPPKTKNWRYIRNQKGDRR